MQTRYSHINKIVSFCFLGIYTLVLFWGSILAHYESDHHHDEAQTCAVVDELNSCHLKISHQDDLKGCDHKTHFEDHDDHCDLCDASVQKTFQQLTTSDQQSTPFYVIVVSLDSEVEYKPFHNLVDRTRGPPSEFLS